MASSAGEVANDIRTGRLKQVYLLYGEEEYLRDASAKRIVDASLEPDTRDFNYAVFRAGEADVASVASAIMSPPAFAERRVVVFRGFDEISADQQRSLVGALQRMPRTSRVVLIATSVDERSGPCKAIAGLGRVVRYRRLYENEAVAWLAAHARELGIDVRPEAREYLVQALGTSIARLAQGFEKACDYAGIAVGTGSRGGGTGAGTGAGGGRQVTLDDVKAASTGEPALGIFDLVDAVGERNTAKAVAAVRRLLGFGEVPVRILAMIARQIRLVLQTKALQAEGATVQKIVAVTRLQDFVVRKCLAQARNFEIEEIEDAFAALAQADVDLKTSGATEEVVLERLIVHLCTYRSGDDAARP
ncbi:MAG: DNA polymerase III subunit delta [Bacillota bacterium]|nr:DNA polymerase III subunit delta [Bacillota bacterium]